MKSVWPLQEAKNKLSEVVRKALEDGPQRITVRGEETAVVLAAADYRKLVQPKTDLAAFFRNSPLAGVDLDLERDKDTGRDIDF